jgi:hypothetical protein
MCVTKRSSHVSVLVQVRTSRLGVGDEGGLTLGCGCGDKNAVQSGAVQSSLLGVFLLYVREEDDQN